MKNILTGAAQPVTDTNERVRKLFENRPFNAPAQPERQNRPRKTFTKAAAEEEAVLQDDAPEGQTTDEDDAPEVDSPEVDESPLGEDEPEEE